MGEELPMKTQRWKLPLSIAMTLAAFAAGMIHADQPLLHPDKPNAIHFSACKVRFVRFLIHTCQGQPCIDELEVYGPEGERNLALANHGAKATASSCLTGFVIHQIHHLNDGLYGNERIPIREPPTGGRPEI